jgi:hypothetical protein
MEDLGKRKMCAMFVPHCVTSEQEAVRLKLVKSLFSLWMMIIPCLTQF